LRQAVFARMRSAALYRCCIAILTTSRPAALFPCCAHHTLSPLYDTHSVLRLVRAHSGGALALTVLCTHAAFIRARANNHACYGGSSGCRLLCPRNSRTPILLRAARAASLPGYKWFFFIIGRPCVNSATRLDAGSFSTSPSPDLILPIFSLHNHQRRCSRYRHRYRGALTNDASFRERRRTAAVLPTFTPLSPVHLCYCSSSTPPLTYLSAYLLHTIIAILPTAYFLPGL